MYAHFKGSTEAKSVPCPEKFIVFSALCFCFSCCLLLLSGVLLLVLGDEELLFIGIQ